MAGRHYHFDIDVTQRPKLAHLPCGDVAYTHRTLTGTVALICDGLGSGIPAHVAANLCQSRLAGLLESGQSPSLAVAAVVRTLDQYKRTDGPYTAFSLCHIRPDGLATIWAYEAPAPILVCHGHAKALPVKDLFIDNTLLVHQCECYLRPGDWLVLISDGISQAGLGHEYRLGWGSDGAAAFLQSLDLTHMPSDTLLRQIFQQAFRVSHGQHHDDMTGLAVTCRYARELTILTGPPQDTRQDRSTAQCLLAHPGPKVICGATTAQIVARHLNQELTTESTPQSLITPPRYFLEGVDLVTEGTVTLNQLLHCLDLPSDELDPECAVTDLFDLITQADRIHILLGTARNPANDHIAFHQQGILPRHVVIDKIAAKLQSQGKLVMVDKI